MSVLSGGVFGSATDDLTDLRNLVDEIGARSFAERIGGRSLPDAFDATAWRHLEEAGLTRLSSAPEFLEAVPSRPPWCARSLARHAVSVPVAETTPAGWLAARAGLEVPEAGPLTVATELDAVPYASEAAAVVLALPDGERLRRCAHPGGSVDHQGHNAGGEPRDTVATPGDGHVTVDAATELTRRGARARCVQTIGALDAAVEFSVAHTREREQFGRPLSAFQSVQHTLAGMAGEVERARAATDLAVAAAADHGFGSDQTDFAVTVAKVTLGQVVPTVITAAHQLHGAIGVTIEHRLWLATMRARSWIGEFGDNAHYAPARRLALNTDDPWTLVVDGA